MEPKSRNTYNTLTSTRRHTAPLEPSPQCEKLTFDSFYILQKENRWEIKNKQPFDFTKARGTGNQGKIGRSPPRTERSKVNLQALGCIKPRVHESQAVMELRKHLDEINNLIFRTPTHLLVEPTEPTTISRNQKPLPLMKSVQDQHMSKPPLVRKTRPKSKHLQVRVAQSQPVILSPSKNSSDVQTLKNPSASPSRF